MPTFTIFAGVNGSGKTTIANKLKEMDDLGITINADIVANELGDMNDITVQIKAGKIAFNRINECIINMESFNFESTFSGLGIFEIIKKAKSAGFKVSLIYIAIEKELSKDRIKTRVIKGGHNIPNDIIERRYEKSIKNFNEKILLFDEIMFFENSTDTHSLIAMIKEGKLVFSSDKIPNWISNKFNIF
jgi:predicted ABC-type ATPase